MPSLRNILVLASGAAMLPYFADASGIRINEIADKGSDTICEGEDWVELFNDSTDAVVLDGYILHDDEYPVEVGKELTFPH